MLYCRSSRRKEYMAPDSVRDLRLRELVETEFGLKVSEWSILWYSEHDPDIISEFLSPETAMNEDE
ncbi:hypothetical protein RSAG8_10258, partial [Rhizoctonia solani AG-8 WAC10335]